MYTGKQKQEENVRIRQTGGHTKQKQTGTRRTTTITKEQAKVPSHKQIKQTVKQTQKHFVLNAIAHRLEALIAGPRGTEARKCSP